MLESRSFAINRRPWLGVLVLSASTALMTGCIIESNNCDECDCAAPYEPGVAGSGGGTSAPENIVLATIDTNATLDTTPGEGIGAFVEYAEGGRWHVFTACDTVLSGLPCYFNVIAVLAEGATYSALQEDSLESYEDEIYEYADGVELVTVTRNEVDGMYFDAPPGDVVRFEVYLDGEPDARFIYWVGGGAVHNGAPSNPIDLKPSEP